MLAHNVVRCFQNITVVVKLLFSHDICACYLLLLLLLVAAVVVGCKVTKTTLNFIAALHLPRLLLFFPPPLAAVPTFVAREFRQLFGVQKNSGNNTQQRWGMCNKRNLNARARPSHTIFLTKGS